MLKKQANMGKDLFRYTVRRVNGEETVEEKKNNQMTEQTVGKSNK